MTTFYKIFLVFLSILLFNSCYNYIPQSYYVPHEGNTLKLKEKDDLLISAGAFNNNRANVFYDISSNYNEYRSQNRSFQIAYSPKKYLGVFGFHARSKNLNTQDGSLIYHKSHLTGGGAGSYYSFKFHQRPAHKRKPDSPAKYTKIMGDIYGGYANGKLENFYLSPSSTDFNFQKFYVQGGLHWEGSNWGMSFVQKLGRMNFYKGIINGKPDNTSDTALQSARNKNYFSFNEFTFKVDVMAKGIGLYAQVTSGNTNAFDYNIQTNSVGHLGMVFNISEVRKNFFQKK